MISLQILNVFCVLMALSYYEIDAFVLYYNDISILYPQKLSKLIKYFFLNMLILEEAYSSHECVNCIFLLYILNIIIDTGNK